jgi:MFS transporter, DHA1 family, tetracycline resistance protein
MNHVRKPALVFIFITLVLDILGIGLIVPILPKLVEQLGGAGVEAAADNYGLLASLYALMQFVFAPLLGSLSDRFGRRAVILGSLFGAGIDLLFMAVAPTLGWLFVGRIVSGITGANFAAATAYIADVTPPEKRAASFGMIGAAFGLGFIIGPLMGGWLGSFGLRVPFYVSGVLTLVNWLYGLFVLPESLSQENRRAFSWARSNPLGALLALRRHPTALGLIGVLFIAGVAHQVFPSIWVLYTTYRYSWTMQQTGMSLAAVGLMAAIVQGGLTRIIVAKLGEVKTIMFGFVTSTLAFVAYGTAPEGWMIYAVIFTASVGGAATPALQALISKGVGADEQGGVQGAIASLSSISGVIGPLICTRLFAYFISDRAPQHLPGAPFYFSAVLSLVAAIIAMRVLRGKGSETTSA